MIGIIEFKIEENLNFPEVIEQILKVQYRSVTKALCFEYSLYILDDVSNAILNKNHNSTILQNIEISPSKSALTYSLIKESGGKIDCNTPLAWVKVDGIIISKKEL